MLINYKEFTLEKPTRVIKKWGWEDVIVNNDLFCGKILKFHKNAKFSLHMHDLKTEYFFAMSGKFNVTLINTANADKHMFVLEPGNGFLIPRLTPHQVECLEEGEILEISNRHFDEDSLRIGKGDNQM